MAGTPLIPLTLAVTLVGALATYLAPRRYVPLVAFVSSAPALAVTSMMFYLTGAGGGEYRFTGTWDWIPWLNIHFEFGVDGLSAGLAWLTALLTPLVILYSWHERERPHLFFSLLVLMDATVMGVFTALDLFLFYVFWEFVLIPMYLLIAIWGGSNRKYASAKFFIYTGTASLVMLVAFMALFFGAGRSFSIPEITAAGLDGEWTKGMAYLVFGILALGFLVKVPSVPFHTWLPDAHVQAPTAGSVLLAGVLLKMGSYGLMRIAIPVLPEAAHAYQWVLVALGTVSVLYGAFLSLAQDDLKSLIAYSSVSHMGLVVLGLATFTKLGWAGAAFMNIAHGIISAGMFMAAGSLQHSTGTRLISHLGGVATRVPALAGLTAALFLASLGLPFMAGFIAELAVFAAVWEAFGWFILVPIWSILVTAGYYLWALQRAFYGPERHHPEVHWDHIHDVPREEFAPMFALVLAAIALGTLPALLMGQVNDWTLAALAAVAGGVS